MPWTHRHSWGILHKIQEVLNREHDIAKQQLAAGHKDRALLTLRKRKYQEGLLAKTDAQLENLDHLVRRAYPLLPVVTRGLVC